MRTSIPLLVIAMVFSQVALADGVLRLDQFINLALEKNLDLKVEAAKARAAASNAKALNIPPPMVGYMRMTDQSGSSSNGFEITQTVPFPTKVTESHAARKYESESVREELDAREAEIRARAKVVYFSLWAAQEKLAAMKEKEGAIQSHIVLARAGVRSDSFLRIHLLKAESDLDLLENDLIAANQEIVEKQAAAAVFLNLDVSNFHPTLEEPPITSIPSQSSLESPHQLEASKYQFESFKARESEMKSSWFPDLYLRYKQIGQTQLMPETSEIMVGVSLPFIFPWDSSSASGKASNERAQSEFAFEQEQRKIEAEKEILFARAKSLKAQLDNITQKLLPRAEKRMKLVHNLAPRDMESLQDHLETMDEFPNLKLKSLELRTQYEETVAELAKYMRDAQ